MKIFLREIFIDNDWLINTIKVTFNLIKSKNSIESSYIERTFIIGYSTWGFKAICYDADLFFFII